MDELIEKLSQAGLSGKFGEKGDPFYVSIWVRDRFRCVYCGENLLQSRVHMSSAQLDHLLPKKKYPSYSRNPANIVLSCFCCNIIKHTYDVLADEDLSNEVKNGLSPETFDDYRHILIERCKRTLEPFLKKRDAILEGTNKVLNDAAIIY